MTTLMPKYYQGATGSVNRIVDLKLADTVSVKDFGAIGDGTTDDSVAIQAAINAVASAGGGAVYFPAGTYKGYGVIDSVNNVTLYGDGKGISTIYREYQTADGQAIISIKTTTASVSNITIKNLTLKSSLNSTLYDAFGVECNRVAATSPNLAYNISVIDCEVNNTMSAGIVLRNVINARVTGCYVHNTGRDGIQLIAQNGYIANNYIDYTADDCIGAHESTDSAGRYTTSYQIVNNYCGVTPARGIACSGARDTVISGNTIRGWGYYGIFIVYDYTFEKQTPVRIIIANNTILEASFNISSQAALGIYCDVNQATFPTNNFVDYPNRGLVYVDRYPGSHIKIVDNYIGTSEYVGKTVDSVTYYNPQYGVRLVAPGAYQNISIDGNSFYGLSVAGVQVELQNAAEYGASKTQIRNNDFRACFRGLGFTGGSPTTTAWTNDIFVINNYIDGTNSFGYATTTGILANGVTKLFISTNSFNALTTSLSSSSSSISAYNNVFENCSVFGTITHSYDSATNVWTEA